ncbi:TPA: hypothetical protein QIB15_004884 [Klebsiella aerogenes]|uniref:hypothetical protein n=1 Tax=Klebsiella aerogenes TaxID=548 RepID=UPI0024761D9F|nr:hypothetical protein [Klebsiella aerogenes]HBT3294940.1 hypothetical protein [Klebsiella aerogenes]HDT0389785.1 hypothetical protein [Klebsiella aerogenes]HEO9734407.1 hypothetical protein [Klebsiella aerogenes]
MAGPVVFPAALRLDGLLVVRLVVFPAALRLDGLLVVRLVVFPAALRLAGLLVAGLWLSQRRCAWPGYWWCGLRDG